MCITRAARASVSFTVSLGFHPPPPLSPQDVQCLTERTSQHEVQLIQLRFISILLSYRKKDKRKDAKVRAACRQ